MTTRRIILFAVMAGAWLAAGSQALEVVRLRLEPTAEAYSVVGRPLVGRRQMTVSDERTPYPIELSVESRAAQPFEVDLRKEIQRSFERVDLLRRTMAEHPELAIPEIQLLSEREWFEFALEVSDRRDIRNALGSLRTRAKYEAAELMLRALKEYANAHAGRLPASTAALAEFGGARLTSAILARYEMLKGGDIDAFGPNDWLVGEIAPVDPAEDQRLRISAQRWRTDGWSGAEQPGDAIQ